MTAVLNAIRRLDALLDRGEISTEEYAKRRSNLLNTVEDVQPDIIDITPVERPIAAEVQASETPAFKSSSSAVGLGFVVVLVVMGLCIALTLLFLDNMNLALTLGVTILAAICVALLQESDT
ncbi:MAG: SHOCT domain-containing protein [Roseobacter sp.]